MSSEYKRDWQRRWRSDPANRQSEAQRAIIRKLEGELRSHIGWPLMDGFRAALMGRPRDDRQDTEWRRGYDLACARHGLNPRKRRPRVGGSARQDKAERGGMQSAG